jgi:ppGpp synthetase/RelA/SpoT-type nucleotidyltranferase
VHHYVVGSPTSRALAFLLTTGGSVNSKSQVDRLGERLREQPWPDDESLRHLQEIRAEFELPMARAAEILRGLGFSPTSRLKTVTTLIEKLKREKTRLSSIHDLAGLRVVDGDDPSDQDSTVVRIAAAFKSVTVIDRRLKPSHGYRAVHVIASVEDRHVEIQVRTRLQDLWAQAFERLGDRLGRGIRYGREATNIHSELGGVQASELLQAADRLSKAIAILEDRPSVTTGSLEKRRAQIAASRDEVIRLFSLFKRAGITT